MADYAGDLLPEQAWALLSENPDAVLVDVRTNPEWSFVGVPDLSSLGKRAALISWQVYPSMERNADFEAALDGLGVKADAPILFLCRSGARSRAAAIAATAAGRTTCYNIAYGFEGDPNAERHRGQTNGWKASNLPWAQQ